MKSLRDKTGRAAREAQKKEVIIRLFNLWNSEHNKHLRLGQMLAIVFEETEVDMKGDAKHYMCIFSKEDYDMIEELEKHFAKREKN